MVEEIQPLIVQPKKRVSELCLVSFLLSLFGILVPFSLLAIIFGIAGLMQASRQNLSGKWMAIVGMILAVVWISIVVIAVLMGISIVESYLASFNLESLLKNF